MKKRTIRLTVLLLLVATAASAQQPRGLKVSRDEFLREVLNRQPSPRTHYYDQNIPGSYRLAKLDALRGLPEMAKAQNVDLRGTILIGPYGPSNLQYAYAFIAEKNGIRVNQMTVTESRFTYKSSGTMTRAQYDEFFNGMVNSKVLQSGLPSDENKYEILMARWSGGALETYYGSSISPPPGSNIKEFSKLLAGLLKSLAKTYPLLPRGTGKRLPE